MLKKMLAIALSLALAATTLPMTVYAADVSGEESHTEELAQDIIEQDDGSDPFDFVEGDSEEATRETIPDKFDLSGKFIDDGDNTPYVTPVRFQNPFGSCWGFAAVAACEISLLGDGLAQLDEYDAGNLDLSEKHLSYFVSQPIMDKTHSQYGEGRYTKNGVTASQKINMGGQPVYATSLFSSGIGPNLEDRNDVEEYILKYRGKNGDVEKRKIDGKMVNFCYDSDDDWSIPEKYRFYQSYQLKESVTLPTPAGGNDKTYKYNASATKAIKTELLKKHGVTVGFCADSFMPSQEAGDGKYISKNWAHYTYTNESVNHGVCIVGWDDSYSRDNFVDGHKPPKNMFPDGKHEGATDGGNGAWLVKNSWGSGEEEFPTKGYGTWGIPNEDGVSTGYFWISYYDKSLSMLESFAFDKSNVGSEYYLDQYDLLGPSDYQKMEDDEEMFMANVFKAEGCMNLTQVTCQTARPNTKVKSEVYILSDNFVTPRDGVRVASTDEEQYAMGGYHKMDLTSPVTIQKGQYYSVVQRHMAPNGKYILLMPKALGEGYVKTTGASVWSKGVINKKESFVGNLKEWDDYKNLVTMMRKEDPDNFFTYDNLPIKAVGEKKDNLRMSVDSSVKLSSRGSMTSDTLRVKFKGDMDLLPDDIAVSFGFVNSSRGISDTSAIVDVTQPDPNDDTLYKIKAKKAGKVKLVIKADGVGQSIVDINVVEPKFLQALIWDNKHVYTGKAIKCGNISVVDNLDGEVNKKDYTVSYKNNIKCGAATAIIKPASGSIYKTSISAKFRIVPKKAVISSFAAGKNKLTVKVKSQKKSGATRYQVSYHKKGKKKWITKKFSTKSNKLVLKGLKKGAKYKVRVRAFAKNAGYGKYSNIRTSPKVK